jgi:hypothetical protein
MTIKHILLGLSFGTSISFVSWMVGIIFNGLFAKRAFYQEWSNLNFISSPSLNKLIGLEYFKWFVKNTPFKFFNQNIKVNYKQVDLHQLRNQMTLAEISHLVAFVFVACFAMYFGFRVSTAYGLAIMVPNIFLNLYPSLLQQQNKRRIDTLMGRQKL